MAIYRENRENRKTTQTRENEDKGYNNKTREGRWDFPSPYPMKMAIYLCRQVFRTPNADIDKLMKDIAKYLDPIRLDRRDTRNIKAKSFVGFVYRVAA